MAQRHGRPSNIDDDAPKPNITRETLRESMQVFRFVAPYKWSLIIGLVLLFISSVVFLSFFTIFKWMVNAAEGGEAAFELSLMQFGLLMIGILIFQGLVSYFRVMLFAVVSENATADLRKAVYNKIIALPIPFFEQNKSGELLSRLTSDVERLYSTFSITLAEFVRQIIILVGSVTLLFFTSAKLTFIMLATFPVVVIIAMFFGRYIRSLSKERQTVIADTNSLLSETIQTIQAVKTFTNELFESKRYWDANEKIVSISMKYARGRAIFSVFIVTILFGALCYIIWQAAMMVQNDQIMSGDLLAFVSYTAIIGGAIASLGNFYTELLGSVGATERIREILNMEAEVDLQQVEQTVHSTRFKGNVEFENVEFYYPTRSDVEVLKGISMNIKSGQKVALVGTSGAGKSTIMQLLLRFYEYQHGAIKVDGKDIEDYQISALRSNMAIVPQEVILLGDTILNNILYGKPDASREEVIEAAKKSNSWNFIQSFPDGLETMIGERGVKLSGGQRQRIAIARAILRDPSILLLDEATSSLDAESEKVVQDALNVLMEGRTSIIIAHRLATVRDVDCIYVLENGQIIEQGTHQELSAKDNGAYQHLAKLQFELAE